MRVDQCCSQGECHEDSCISDAADRNGPGATGLRPTQALRRLRRQRLDLQRVHRARSREQIDYYLEGIRGTWVASNEAAKKLGQIESYSVYVSELPLSGDFNVVLVTRVESAADLEPNKERNDAFMAAWGDANEKQTQEKVKTYPDIREITGEYRLREVTFK